TPQVAAVGLTEQQARDSGIQVEIYEQDIASVSGASILRDDYAGRAKLVVDAGRQTVVGATFAGHEVGELIHAATIAVVGELPLAKRDPLPTRHPHAAPTRADHQRDRLHPAAALDTRAEVHTPPARHDAARHELRPAAPRPRHRPRFGRRTAGAHVGAAVRAT